MKKDRVRERERERNTGGQPGASHGELLENTGNVHPEIPRVIIQKLPDRFQFASCLQASQFNMLCLCLLVVFAWLRDSFAH